MLSRPIYALITRSINGLSSFLLWNSHLTALFAE